MKPHILIVFLTLAFVQCSKPSQPEQTNNADSSSHVKTLPAQGDYATSDNSATINVSAVSSNEFEFAIDVVTENANCTGSIQGTATNKEDGWVFNSGEGCTLSFDINNDVITVTEKNDGGGCDHGAACSFAGTFSKANEKKLVSAPAMNGILDYYYALPDYYFECELDMDHSRELRDSYLTYKADNSNFMLFKTNEFDSVQMALFSDAENKTRYVAYVNQCGEGCQCNLVAFLSFENGEWVDHADEVFPDLSQLIEDPDAIIGYQLPEEGTDIVVYDYYNRNRRLGTLKWNGIKFEFLN